MAAGHPLSFPEEGVVLRGHTIEFRINAEDPERKFAPSPGQIVTFHPPGGPGVRLDTHVYSGYHMPPYYDSLLAKLIVHGATREEALLRGRNALSMFVVEGVHTTIDFLGRIVRHPDFWAGDIDTSFVDQMMHESNT